MSYLDLYLKYLPKEVRRALEDELLQRDSLVGSGGVLISKDGVPLGTATSLNFRGVDVSVTEVSPGVFDVSIPPATFLSHWNTSDGTNGSQSVTDSSARVVSRIADPSGGEGTPFNTSGWSQTDQSASLTGVPVFTTPGDTTGFGGDSTVTVTVYDADGVAVLDSYTTPAITGNGVFPSPSTFINVTITNYGVDATKFKANLSVSVDANSILSNAGFDGGRYHVEITHTPDSTTDGTGPYTYVQSDVFLDTNPTTPSVSGSITIAETIGSIVTKHLSGLEFYILTSQFTSDVTGIDQLNRNTARVNSNLQLIGTEYGLPLLNHSPFGTGSGNFSGYTFDHDQDNVSYQTTNWAISQSNYRFMAPTGNVSVVPKDPWANGSTVDSAGAAILVDTYLSTSTALIENFDDEDQREFIDGVNGAASVGSFPGAGMFPSSTSLVTVGGSQAQVFAGQLWVPAATTHIGDGVEAANSDWTTFKPDAGGANPDYSTLTAPVNYGRRFTQASGPNIPSFQMLFQGTFANGSALADVTAGDLEIYVYRVAGSGNVGAPPTNTNALRLHVSYNFALFDDGATVSGSGILLGSSSGNQLNGTFGGLPADTGFYCHIIVKNAGTVIDRVEVQLN